MQSQQNSLNVELNVDRSRLYPNQTETNSSQILEVGSTVRPDPRFMVGMIFGQTRKQQSHLNLEEAEKQEKSSSRQQGCLNKA